MMKIRKLSILAVSETRLRGDGDKNIHENYRFIYSGSEQGRHGVGFILDPDVASYVEKVTPLNERLIALDLRVKDGISIVQVYAPQQGRPLVEKEEFYQQLQGLKDEAKY